MSATQRATKDYGLFQLHDFNRNADKLRYLEESMRKHGWIEAYPMHVFNNGKGKLKIKAGHHRFEVARKLGIAARFAVCDDTATIHELERATRPWNLKDYLVSHLREGKNAAYIEVDQYQRETGIGLSNCISILGGELAASNNKSDSFKNGTYKINDGGRGDVISQIVKAMKKNGVKFATHSNLVLAISRIVFIKELDLNRLVSKIKTFAHFIEKQPCTESYIKMIEDIYNRQAGKKVPLAFLADEAARKRMMKGLNHKR